jgi:hypothetical protein
MSAWQVSLIVAVWIGIRLANADMIFTVGIDAESAAPGLDDFLHSEVVRPGAPSQPGSSAS